MAILTPNQPAPTMTPLGQALAKKRPNLLPPLLLAIGLVAAVAFAVLGYLESQRRETVVIFSRDVPFGQQIVAEDLATVELPLHRPAQLQGLADPAAVIGQYAARSLGANDVAQPGMLMVAPPDQPVYPNGEQLAPNMVPLPFATTTIGPLTFRDRVNIGFNDRNGSPDLCDAAKAATVGERPTVELPPTTPAQPRPFACRLLSSVRVLYVDDEQGIAYLEVSPYQAHTIWALQAAELDLWGERYGVASDILPSLDRLDVGQINNPELSAPVPAPEAREASDMPGASSTIPGQP